MKAPIITFVLLLTVSFLLIVLLEAERDRERTHSSQATGLSHPFEPSPVDDHDDILPSKSTRPHVTLENAQTYYSSPEP
ncbi:MAG: hypothetical protein AAF357_19830 [Verrucomicrobiota bacterium]